MIRKVLYRIFLSLICTGSLFISTSSAIPNYKPIVPYLDSIYESGKSLHFIHEHVFQLSMGLMSESKMKEVEMLYDSAVVFSLSHDSYEQAARYLLSKSEFFHMTERIDEALEVLKPIENWKIQDTVRIMYLIAKGSLLHHLNDPTLGKVKLLEALNLSQRLNINWSRDLMYHELSEIAQKQGRFVEAIDYSLKAMDHHHFRAESFHGIHIYLQLSRLFLSIGNVDRAAAYNNKAIELSKEYQSKILLSTSFFRLGTVFQYNQQLDSALHYYRLSIEEANKARFNRQTYHAKLRIASILIASDPEEAEKILFKEGKELDDFSHTPDQWYYWRVLAKYYFSQGKYDLAEKHINNYFETVKDKSRPLAIISAAKISALIAREQGKDDKYRELVELAQSMEDSLFQMRHSHEIYNIESKYIEKEQEEALAKIQKINDARKKQIRLYGLVSLGLLALVSVFYILLRNNRRKSRLLRKKNEQITAVLNEKEILLKEIHHRVKNNLQIISSLLRMQSRNLEDAGAKEALKESENRIHSMAMIHQDLYQEDDLRGVDMPGYIDKLMNHILFSFKRKDNNIEVHKTIEDIKLDIDTVIPLGLILNELITNSFKYAFHKDHGSTITLELKEEQEKLHLRVADNGSTATDKETAGSGFGSKMINALAMKLKADINVDKKNGYEIKMIIKEYRKVS